MIKKGYTYIVVMYETGRGRRDRLRQVYIPAHVCMSIRLFERHLETKNLECKFI